MKQLLLLFLLSSQFIQAQTTDISIIPQPVSIKKGNGKFKITKHTVIAGRDEADRKSAAFLNDYLQEVYGFKLDVDRQEGKDYIRLTTRKFIQAPEKETYSLNIGSNGISIEGDSYAATFNGIQTLIQLLPVMEKEVAVKAGSLSLPFISIYDYPRFAYRGMHLDVARHFFPPAFVKKYIDYLAMHKMNFFHWHLTDDQGWRIEIKKYPNLMATGAWRNGTIIGRYPGTGNDNTRYGGFYTQEEIKDIVQYAAERYITIIPEVEMPGHASAAIASYPWLSCFPEEETKIPTHPSLASQQMKGKKVQETWGVFEDIFCAGKDSTFLFLQGVLDEVVELFPSSYIHLGGDESPKAQWKRCPNCQKRIRELKLKDEHELQSYFVQRMEKYLNSKGRILIGWDEILEGGLAPNAIVMSWRGVKGGIEAAKQNHKVIMSPEKPVYLDHAQTRNEDSLVIGGYNPLEAVYAYDPLPKELDTSKSKFIMGGQANVWTEYIEHPSKVEYVIFPRMSALSEVLWSPKNKISWNDFQKRLLVQFNRYQLWGAHYSRAYFDLNITLAPTKKFDGLQIMASPRDKKGLIQYTIRDKQAPLNYIKPILLKESQDITLIYSRNNTVVNKVFLPVHFNKATGKKVSIAKSPNEKYPGQAGAFSLVNGIYSSKGLSYPDWLGWIGDDIEATIDLGKSQSIDSVRMHTLDQNGSWIHLPQYVEIQISHDGKKWKAAGRSSEFVKDTLTMGWITVRFPEKQNARYVKLIAKNYGIIPDGKPGGGFRAWVFADEIQVY